MNGYSKCGKMQKHSSEFEAVDECFTLCKTVNKHRYSDQLRLEGKLKNERRRII